MMNMMMIFDILIGCELVRLRTRGALCFARPWLGPGFKDCAIGWLLRSGTRYHRWQIGIIKSGLIQVNQG